MCRRNQAKRESLFRRGSAALQRLGADKTIFVYVCPLCTRGFAGVETLEAELLTLDHVPAYAVGGRTTVLTCKSCNSAAGHALEAEVAAREQAIAFRNAVLGHESSAVIHGTLRMAGEELRVTFAQDGEAGRFEILENSNDPTTVARFYDRMESIAAAGDGDGMEITMTMTRGFHGRRALVGDLKAAYLVAFAAFGYSYALHPDLDVVRQQIQDPQAKVIERWWLNEGLGQEAEPELTALTLATTAPQDFLGVRLKRSTVLLPWPAGGDIYTRMAEATVANEPLLFKGYRVPWPSHPEMWLDFGTRPRGRA